MIIQQWNLNRGITLIILFCFIILLFLPSIEIKAQTDTGKTGLPKIELSGYVDVFYVFDFNQPTRSYRQTFFYNYNRHNQFNLNLGYVRLTAEHPKYRANIVLQTGTYANDNYANEPGLLKNIYEANVGVSLNKKNTMWLDAGIFASHIGFESAISIDNWTLTRSILAENSPYYLTGAKWTYQPNDKWELGALICNGWQHIQKVKENSLPSFGTQVKFKPNEHTILNWSTFIGTDDPDATRRMRYFNNFYGQYQLTKRIGLTTGFDIGAQQKARHSQSYDLWFSPVVMLQYAINKQWKTTIRAEYYQDKTGIIIQTGTINGFKTRGVSVNLDYSPAKDIQCRIEGRWLNSKDKIFDTKTSLSSNNFFIGSSIAMRFSEMLRK